MASEGAPLINLNLTEPISKLIETIGSGIGLLYEPTRIRRKAEAEAHALEILANGRQKVQEIEARAQVRLSYLELRRQKNIEAIIGQAARHIPGEVSKEPVDEDWTIDFFGQCQDVGNETLQSLWARLLAGEVTSPGSFSRRTLHTVKTMEKRDADLFTRFAGFVWDTPERPAHIVTKDSMKLLKMTDFHKVDFFHLQSIGLLERAQVVEMQVRTGVQCWSYLGRRVSINRSAEGQRRVMLLTRVGEELLPVSGATACSEYFESVVSELMGAYTTLEFIDEED